MSKPSILLVTGSFSLPEHYDLVVKPIAAQGYDIRALELRSVGPREGELPSVYDDAAYIAGEAEKLADEGKDVIIVAHSYGGAPATISVKGLSKVERQKQGKKGGIVRLTYMTAIVPAVGETAGAVLVGVEQEPRIDMKVDEKGWLYHDDKSATAKIVFNSVPFEQGLAWAEMMPQHSPASFAGELTYAGYKDVPVSYLVCENDLCIPAYVQREGIDLIEKVSGNKVEVTSVATDHAPNFTAPQKVIDWILDVASKV